MTKSDEVLCFENIWLLLETIIGKSLFQINWPIKSRGSRLNAWTIISPTCTRAHLLRLSLSLSFLLFLPHTSSSHYHNIRVTYPFTDPPLQNHPLNP